MASIEELRAERVKKLELLKEKGMSPYPITSHRTHSCADALSNFDALVSEAGTVVLDGRILALRGQGKLMFADITDGTGNIQALMKSDKIDADLFALFADTVDIGDVIEVSGTPILSQRGEKSIEVVSWRMLAKSLRPLPDKWHGLKDTEERFRRRYLDLIASPEVKERFAMRAKAISAIRRVLDDAGYMEVETPMLQSLAGGALAQPFKTHHNSLDTDMYLRIAPELYLKELLIGGYPKVYEIGRNFRNEGIDVTHNPEFTMLEFYEAFGSAKSQIAFTEKLIRETVTSVLGKPEITHDGNPVSLAEPFAVIPFKDLFVKYADMSDPFGMPMEDLLAKAASAGVTVKKGEGREKILDGIYKKLCRPHLSVPTFIIDYPKAFSPFAKEQDEHPELIDRFQLVIAGLEIVNAFSELNDPLEQRRRFEEQEKKKSGGDEDISPKDDEFLEAMEYGMPPAGGVGIGIDRIVMLLTDMHNIREVILFPTLRTKE
ncbi:MAG: lysine--tRNA ligase [Candidatus Yonathbacteria bacterium]|nr:lysine--tRNA ligase [Candidatus Yonathbacteria bacterium]